jgi:hypothetical protein
MKRQLLAWSLVLVTACNARGAARGSAQLTCDPSLASAFEPDEHTKVLLVQAFRAGDPVALANSPADPAPVLAPTDMCMVKLLVGPGKPGTPGAPSTSPGIGIEVWLPSAANWNERIRAYGSSGWAGGFQADITRIGARGGGDPIHLAAVNRGFVVSTSDHGHGGGNHLGGNGSFAMNEDGSINTVLWHDFADRSLHELAQKSKALVLAYYGKPHEYAYWDGFSTGGRQGYYFAQHYPHDFDGILAGAPAINWTRFLTASLYPQIVMQRALGGVIPASKLHAVSAAANASCGGATLGFQIDPTQCRYDPTKDAAALCTGVAGIGTNRDASKCVTLDEARAINKIWYGQTVDGSVSAKQLWWGPTRGTVLASPTCFGHSPPLAVPTGAALAGEEPSPIVTTQVALELQDPAIAQRTWAATGPLPVFTNATGNGADGWKNLSYEDLARAAELGLALQPSFSNIDTDSVDLSAARDAGVKILSYHGWADELIPPQGSINYFERLQTAMGGTAEVQQFNRLFMIPGYGHLGTPGTIDPATGMPTSPDKVPMPEPATGRDEMFEALMNWVEDGHAPERIELRSRDGSVTMPICAYPKRAVEDGSGYACR